MYSIFSSWQHKLDRKAIIFFHPFFFYIQVTRRCWKSAISWPCVQTVEVEVEETATMPYSQGWDSKQETVKIVFHIVSIYSSPRVVWKGLTSFLDRVLETLISSYPTANALPQGKLKVNWCMVNWKDSIWLHEMGSTEVETHPQKSKAPGGSGTNF